MTDQLTDPALAVLGQIQNALLKVFDPASSNPPHGGGSDTVFTFTGEGAPLDVFMPGGECSDEVFVWQRLTRRFRVSATGFPATYTGEFTQCKVGSAIAVEFGVARCSNTDALPGEDDLDEEALTGLDDSWRIDLAACLAGSWIRSNHLGLKVGQDAVTPWGPEGGVSAQLTTLYVQFE